MKTFLFGLDGATYAILDHLVEQGVMPNLRRLYEQGARSELTSTPIPITPQAWTTMATGRNAGAHGVSDFVRFATGEQGVFLRINNSRDIHCETIFKHVSDQGRRVTVLNWFGLAPPEPIDGHVMPGFTSGRHLRRSSHPADLFDRLRAIEGLDIKILGLDLDIERQVLQEMEASRWLEWIDHHIVREQALFRVMHHLATHEPSDLTAIVLDGVDKIQHLAYRYLDPSMIPAQPTEWEAEVIRHCHAYFRQVDDFLGRTLELAGEAGRVFIASDHGFTASDEIFYVNKWLHDQGLLVWKGEVDEDTRQAHYSERLGNDANAIDVVRSKAYALAPSANGIIINTSPDEYEAFRAGLIERLLHIEAPDGGRVVTQAWKREAVLSGPYLAHSPDILLRLRDCGFISVLNSRSFLVRRHNAIGTHHPQGVLLGQGPGVRKNARLSSRNILDVAPLLLHSLGLEIPAEYEGSFPADFYEPTWLQSDPARIARPATDSAGDPPMEESVEETLDADEQAIVLDRLRSLGYIE